LITQKTRQFTQRDARLAGRGRDARVEGEVVFSPGGNCTASVNAVGGTTG